MLKNLLWKLSKNLFNKSPAIVGCFLFVAVTSCQTIETSKSEQTEEKKREDMLEARLAIVVNYINLGQPEKAHAELRNLSKDFTENADIENLNGLTQMAFSNFALAETYFRKAYDLKKDPAYGLNLGSALYSQGKNDRALRVFFNLKKKYKDQYRYPERIEHNIGLVYEKMSNRKVAEKYYLEALKDNPAYYPSIMQLGKFYDSQRRNEQAQNQFTQASRICATCYEPVKLMAVNLLETNQHTKAIKVLTDFTKNKDAQSEDRRSAESFINSIRSTTTRQ